MTDSLDIFRKGASALRNARDWAKEKRKELITITNDKISDAEYLDLILFTQSFILVLSIEITYLESKTLANELALDVNTLISFNYRTSIRA